MPYYDTFMNVNKHPAQRWRNQLQDTVDKVFENASTWWDDVWEEKEFGSDALETKAAAKMEASSAMPTHGRLSQNVC